MNSPIENIYEPMTFEKYLMVSKDKEMSNSLEVMLCLIKDYWGYRSKYSFVFIPNTRVYEQNIRFIV